jgi:hypothetical protein
VAVLVAEDITSRFLNVISLFNKAIPLIAIQLRALDVGGVLTMSATTVLDLARGGTDEEDEAGQATDRGYWAGRGSLDVADQVLALINEVAAGMALKYNKHYIGLARGAIADNFVVFRPRREYTIADFRIPRSEEATALINDSGVELLAYEKRYGNYRLRLTGKDVAAHRELLLDLIRRASKTPPPADE